MKLGIFFPIRDAAWELEENAYQEFYEPIKLSCEDVKCKNKCLHAGEMHMWRLCQFCGAGGIHEHCFQGSPNDKYTCNGCEEVFNRPKSDTASESESEDGTESIKSTGTDQAQDKLDNKDNNEKPKSYAATIFGESDVSSDDEVWKQSPQKVINMKSVQSKKKRHKVILSDSDLSDEENQPPSKKVKSKCEKKEQQKQKSLANILLGESDASDDSDLDCTLIIL